MLNRHFIMVAVVLSTTFACGALAADLRLMKNDKEAEISVFNSRDAQAVQALYSNKTAEKDRILQLFQDSVQDYLGGENLKCELRLVNVFQNRLYRAQLPYQSLAHSASDSEY